MKIKLSWFQKHVLPRLLDESDGDSERLKALIADFLGDSKFVDDDENEVELDISQVVKGKKDDLPDVGKIVRDAIADAMKAFSSSSPRPKHDPEDRDDGELNMKAAIPARDKAWGNSIKSFTGTVQEKQFKAYAFGNFCKYLYSSGTDQQSAKWLVNSGIMGKDLSGVDLSRGGAFVPDVLAADIIRLVETYGTARRRARVWPMSSDRQLIPRRVSGVSGYWVAENAAITKSNVGTDLVELTAKKLASLTAVPTELFEDAIISIGDLLATEIAQTFAEEEDDALFNGTGASTYGGHYGLMVKTDDGTHTAGVLTAATANTAFSTLDLADFHQCVGKLPIYARSGAAWYISGPGYSDSMERLAYAAGGNTVQTIEGESRLSFLGYPVELNQKLNATLTAQVNTVLLGFGNLALSTTFGDRRTVRVSTSEHRYFDQDQIAVRGTERIHINNHDLGDNTNAGPFVVLQTPAS
jgi:HK97 family phage major capsid protein